MRNNRNRPSRHLIDPAPAPAAAPRASTPSTELSIKHLIRVLWRFKVLLVMMTLAAGGAAYYYAKNATRIYAVSAKICIEQTGPRLVREEDDPAQSGKHLYTQVEIIKSLPVLTEALANLDLTQMQTFAGSHNPVATIKELVTVTVGDRDNIVTIAADTARPQETVQIVNAVVDAYLDHNAKKRKTSIVDVLKILQTQLVERQGELDRQRQQLSDFLRDTGAVNLGAENQNLAAIRMRSVSDVMVDAQLRLADATDAYKAAANVLNREVSEIGEANVLAAQRVLFAKSSSVEMNQIWLQLSSELQNARELRKQFLPGHSSIQDAENRVSYLARSYLSVLEQQKIMAERRYEMAKKDYDEQKVHVVEVSRNTLKSDAMALDIQRNEKMIDVLDTRIKELNVTEDAAAMNVSVLEPARASDSPIYPDTRKLVMLGLAVGLALGLALALVRDLTDSRVRSAEDVMDATDMPVLGVVPHIGGWFRRTRRALVTAQVPSSGTSEAYRTIRTALLFGDAAENGRCVLVTSPCAMEGKTTLSCNLSIALAQAGRRVILVDADLRRPSVHRQFSLPLSPGVTDVLAGESPLAEAIKPSGIDGLDILTAGVPPLNPGELVGSTEFETLIAGLLAEYSNVIIDSPPVTLVSDARIISQLVNETILVVRADSTTRKTARAAVDNLLNVGARILGVVINDVSRSQRDFGYYATKKAYGAKQTSGAKRIACTTKQLEFGGAASRTRDAGVRPSQRRRAALPAANANGNGNGNGNGHGVYVESE